MTPAAGYSRPMPRPAPLLLLVALSACAPKGAPPGLAVHTPEPGLRAEHSQGGPWEGRLAAPDGADLALFYGAGAEGALGPCGCPGGPRGGLPRLGGYVRASTDAQPGVPALVVDAGASLFGATSLSGEPRADSPVVNRHMADGLALLRPAAVNVAWTDLPALRALGPTADDRGGLPLLSANLAAPGVAPLRRHTLPDGREIVFIGISDAGSVAVPTPGATASDPEDAARAALEGVQADLVVLLAWRAPAAARALARDGLVDVVIDADQHRYLDQPHREGGAVWVRASHQTWRVGELRIGLAPAGARPRVAWATDRKIELDDVVPEDPDLRALSRRADDELRALRRALDLPP